MPWKPHIWTIAKVIILIISLEEGVSLILNLRDEDSAPPLWISPIAALLCFLFGLLVRRASWTPPWTERELWLANPFRFVLKPWERESYYHPPFFHLGALYFVAGGASALAVAAFSRPVMLGHGATILAMGAGLWLGIRLRDLRLKQKP